MSLAKEFKEFISRGNVVDLAVGVIIGGAFGAIVTSLVKDVVMPPISYLMSGVDVSSWAITIAPANSHQDPHDPTKQIIDKAGVYLTYGNFLQATLNFLIIAADPPVPSAEEKLLIEIRDLLASNNSRRPE